MIILVIPSPFEVQGMSKRLPISKRNDIFTLPIRDASTLLLKLIIIKFLDFCYNLLGHNYLNVLKFTVYFFWKAWYCFLIDQHIDKIRYHWQYDNWAYSHLSIKAGTINPINNLNQSKTMFSMKQLESKCLHKS